MLTMKFYVVFHKAKYNVELSVLLVGLKEQSFQTFAKM